MREEDRNPVASRDAAANAMWRLDAESSGTNCCVWRLTEKFDAHPEVFS